MGRFRYRRNPPFLTAYGLAWILQILVLSIVLFGILVISSAVSSLYCFFSSSIIGVRAIIMGVVGVYQTANDCTRPENELVSISLISNQMIVSGYWHNIFGLLAARGLFIIIWLPFIYIGLNFLLLHPSFLDVQTVMFTIILNIGYFGFFWFYEMLGIMLGLGLRHKLVSLIVYLVFSLILLFLWTWYCGVILLDINEGKVINGSGIHIPILLVLAPYFAWRIAIMTARDSLWQIWLNFHSNII